MSPRVLHLLAQRPSSTGSGVTLEAIVEGAAGAGWQQDVVCGVPAEEAAVRVAGLKQEQMHPLLFEREPLDFPVPGMSDVMPYRSSRFSRLTDSQWKGYSDAWREHLERVIDATRPDLIHAHHAWLMSSLVKELAPDIPLVLHGHATGLRQMELCPDRADEIRSGCARADHFCVLHGEHQRQMIYALGISKEQVSIIGAGYSEEHFQAEGRPENTGESLLYVGKLSASKGVPELLAAFDVLLRKRPGAVLHVAGNGSGKEGAWIERELAGRGASVLRYGQLSREELAQLMRSTSVFVLPSYYEGLPLVLVEAAASGCSLVSTALPGVVSELAPHLGDRLRLVAQPAMETVDQPSQAALPGFVSELAAALDASLDAEKFESSLPSLEPFTWRAVFQRIEKIWSRLVDRAR